MNRLALTAVVALGLVALGVAGSEEGVKEADAAGPPAVQVLSAQTRPRAGRPFLGVAVATLEAGARLSRLVTPTCTSGRIRSGPGQTVAVPVAVDRLPRNPDVGGSVRSVTTCTWQVPRGVRHRTLSASVVVSYVELDGSTGRTGEAVEWEVR